MLQIEKIDPIHAPNYRYSIEAENRNLACFPLKFSFIHILSKINKCMKPFFATSNDHPPPIQVSIYTFASGKSTSACY